MRSLWRTLGLGVLLVAQVSAFDFSGFTDAVKDGDGLVWAIGSTQYVSDSLFSTNGTEWRLVACPGAPDHTRATQLVKLRDGDVLCVWSFNNEEGESKLLLSRHRAEGGRLYAKID